MLTPAECQKLASEYEGSCGVRLNQKGRIHAALPVAILNGMKFLLRQKPE
jgi:hypothetical protein